MDIEAEVAKLKKITARSHAPERKSIRRPWGGFDRFVLNEPCSVKILTIMPGETTSLQSHKLRSEWWVALDAKLEIEVDGKRQTLRRGEDMFIPKEIKHRVFGITTPSRWLEIAFGVEDEEDIVRHEDKYGRTSHN